MMCQWAAPKITYEVAHISLHTNDGLGDDCFVPSMHLRQNAVLTCQDWELTLSRRLSWLHGTYDTCLLKLTFGIWGRQLHMIPHCTWNFRIPKAASAWECGLCCVKTWLAKAPQGVETQNPRVIKLGKGNSVHCVRKLLYLLHEYNCRRSAIARWDCLNAVFLQVIKLPHDLCWKCQTRTRKDWPNQLVI